MKGKTKIKGNLKVYLRWPLLMCAWLLVMNVVIYTIHRKAGIATSIFVLAYVIIAMVLYYRRRPVILGDLVRYATNYGQVQKQLLKELKLPYAVLDMAGYVLWGNNEFISLAEDKNLVKKGIFNIFPDISKDKFPQNDQEIVIHLENNGFHYKAVLRKINAEGFQGDNLEDYYGFSDYSDNNSLIALYLFDETEIIAAKLENIEQRLIVGLIYIDNYEEALEIVDEVRRSLLVALVDRKINKYMQNINAIVKKLEKDKYIVMFKQKYLPNLESGKFGILDEVRGINIGNDIAITISIGVGVNADTYLRGYEYARTGIDLALGRGGDQAVVKNGEKISYYGGKSVQIEKNTKVKARVKAHALKELVEAKDEVVIMGHSIGDVDSLGAAIGVYRIAKTLNKRAYIVINEITTAVRPMLSRFLNNEYEEDLFLNSAQALNKVNYNTLLVVVDVNRPSYTECMELLEQTKTVVILDHHRQSGDGVENAVLSYIEPYASSTCEMVAEILQYIDDGVKLRPAEADAMYSGIMIDTNNFLTKTGVRTFEAAAFLRRNGADVTRIRKAFRSNMEEFKARAESIQGTELYLEFYAITECEGGGIDSPTIIGAQVANELLTIMNVKASFVFTEFNNKVYISARSIDEVNVQVIMEKLGGGGHMSVAGAQLKDCTVKEGINILKETLNKMNEEGEL